MERMLISAYFSLIAYDKDWYTSTPISASDLRRSSDALAYASEYCAKPTLTASASMSSRSAASSVEMLRTDSELTAMSVGGGGCQSNSKSYVSWSCVLWQARSFASAAYHGMKMKIEEDAFTFLDSGGMPFMRVREGDVDMTGCAVVQRGGERGESRGEAQERRAGEAGRTACETWRLGVGE